MPYATQSDLEERFGPQELAQLTDRVDGLMPDPAVIARALADAEAEIDGYLAARYTVPLSAVPAVLVRLTCDIARYRLYDDRVTEAVRNWFLRMETRAELERLSDRELNDIGLTRADIDAVVNHRA